MAEAVHKINEFVFLGKSGIHSNGIFAAKDILKGTRVIEYTGEIISKEEGSRRQELYEEIAKKDHSKGSVYVFELDDERDLDGNRENNYAKYINHSCDTNCEFLIGKDSVWIIAKRDIKKGEELSYNYGFEFDDTDYHEYVCKCGSPNCVGYMVCEDDWPKLKEHLAVKHGK